MKRLFSLLLAFTIMFSLCACQGNFGSVNLNESVEIPENGIIKESLIQQIRSENAVGVFTGKSGDYKYEWTIFGSDIKDATEINLGVQIRKTTEGNIQILLQQVRAFGFSALLSIYLNEQWAAQSATAYVGGEAFASVSITGSKTSVLNLTLDGSADRFEIRPDALPKDEKETQATETTTPVQTPSLPVGGQDEYLSIPESGNNKVQNSGKDKYNTDPVPEGKPQPVEPENQDVDKEKTYTCTFAIECATILNNLDMLDPDKLEMVPSSGVILSKTTVTFYEGESVFDVLQRVCKEKGIHMEASWTPIYNSAYVEGIHNLYEFDCGALSGWMYKVNGWYPNYGSSRYQLQNGDVVEWRFTCDLGNDVGGGYAVGG